MKHQRMSIGLCALVACAGIMGACGSVGSTVTAPPGEEPVAPELKACREDLGLSPAECTRVMNLKLPETLPPARGNKYADNLQAAELGFRMFYDARFSNVQDLRCATCHLPETAFDDAKTVGIGKATLTRNSPTILTAAWMEPVFWDGRADSLWSQPLFAFESPDEMDMTRLELAHVLFASPYKSKYESIFGQLPALEDEKRFPRRGRPGEPAFDEMAAADRDAVNLIAANIGKSLEAYMRKVSTGMTGLDHYLAGDREALTVAEKKGVAAFVKAKCIDCHSGPSLSDGKFYDMKVPLLPGAGPDRGRAKGLEILAGNVFNAQGPYYDREGDPPVLPPAATPADEGAFRTPTLRNIGRTAPYGHNGFYPTLDAILAAHGEVKLDAEQTNSIMVLLLSLDGAYPQRPWSDWPAR